jgi:glutamate racemase
MSNKHSSVYIGVFDSGIGGISILRVLEEAIPSVQYIYVGDTANIPYGTKSTQEIQALAIGIVNFLVMQQVSMIVVACNTATEAAIKLLRQQFSLPIIGVVPAIKPATSLTKTRHIGVAATKQTVESETLHTLIKQFGEGIDVTIAACPKLVMLAESGIFSGEAAEEIVLQSLECFRGTSIDVLVLGCTHFPLLQPLIQKVMGKEVLLLENSDAIAQRVCTLLRNSKELETEIIQGERKETIFYCTGDEITFSYTASRIIGKPIKAIHIQPGDGI